MRGLRIGKIFGIDLIIDPSWILIFAFMTWSLAASFAQVHPNWPMGLPLAVGASATILFFLSILLHELAHSVVAIVTGLKVRSITLFIFGGISSIEQEPRSPGSEALMALAGPLVSIGIGFWLTVIAGYSIGLEAGTMEDPTALAARLGVIPTLFAWLGPVNMLVGIFNLIPAFPLDGGRVLRAILWATTKDLRRATSWASATGQAFAWLFIMAGIAIAFGAQLPFFGTGLASGLWLVLIGWFLNSAATRSHERVLIEGALEGLTVGRVMRQSVPSIPPDIPLSTLVSDWFMARDARAFPVVDEEGRLLGMVSLSDVRAAPRDQWDSLRARDVMTPLERLVTIAPNARAFDALELMATRDVAQLPVVQDGKLVGMIERRDILRWLELARPTGAPPRPSYMAR